MPFPVFIVTDPKEVVKEIFQVSSIYAIPWEYWFAMTSDQYLYNFMQFLEEAGMDASTLDDRTLVYMALLYGKMEKKVSSWTGDAFEFSTIDSQGASLDIYFQFPSDKDGELAVILRYNNEPNSVYIETSTKDPIIWGPGKAMQLLLPDTDFFAFNDTFEFKLDEGAYKGTKAQFRLKYIVHSPRDPFKIQSLYYEEEIEFTLPNKESITITFKGSFKIPLYDRLDEDDLKNLSKLLPQLFRNALELEGNVGATQLKEEDFRVIVFGFGDKREEVKSIQQFFEPSLFSIDRAQFLFVKMVDFIEGFDMEKSFIDENKAPENLTFRSFNKAKEAIQKIRGIGRGYIIVMNGGKYTVYFLTTADMIWLAKKMRKETASEIPRYAGIDLNSIEDAEFFELPYAENVTLQSKLDDLKFAYFSKKEELTPYYSTYNLVYELNSGFFAITPISKEDAKTTWQEWDANNDLPNKILISDISYQPEALILRADEEKMGIFIQVDAKHYAGRRRFVQMYFELKVVKDVKQINKIYQQYFNDQVDHFLINEMMRPRDWNKDEALKEALKALKFPGSSLNKKLADMAFGMVAYEAEKKGVEMMEDMLILLDEMVKDDMMLKLMIMSFKQREAKEQKEVAKIFTEDEDDAEDLVKVVGDDASLNKLLMGGKVKGLDLDILAAKVKENRDELKSALEERKGMLKKTEIRYDALFLMQPGELGTAIREHVYDVFGFDLDPKKFPPEEHTTEDYPSPLHEGGKDYTRLLEQLYINRAVNIHHKFELLKTIQGVAMVASVFSLARGAGMWAVARAGLAEGTKKALLLSAVVTSVTAGILIEGIQVAFMGKSFSWKDLGITIGEAFFLMYTFGWLNSLVRLPIATRFALNAVLFVGYGVGRFIVVNKRLPSSFEFNLIMIESVLMLTLIHIGTKITDPFFRRILKLPNVATIRYNIRTTLDEIALEAAKKSPNRARALELGEKLMEHIREYRAWVEKNANQLNPEEVKAELEKIDQILQQWTDAKLVDIANLSPIAQTKSAFYYKPGEDATRALKEKFGEDNVQIDETTGLGKVTTPEGTFRLIPQEMATDPALTGETPVNQFGNNVRLLDLGVYSYKPGYGSTIRSRYIRRQGGATIIEMGKDLFIVEYATPQGRQKVVFIEETSTVTIENAIQLEGQLQGAGIEYLQKSLGQRALKGLEVFRGTRMRGEADIKTLEELKSIEQEARTNRKTLTQYLEDLYLNLSYQDAVTLFSGQKTTRSSLRDLRAADKKLRDSTGKGLTEMFPELTEIDMVAILRYTKNAQDLSSTLHSGQDPAVKFSAWKVVLNNALAKLPKYKGVVYRGYAFEEAYITEKYVEGSTVTERGFSSTTKLPETADFYMERAATRSPTRIRTKFFINTKSGVYVEELSWSGKNFRRMTPEQQEVILPSETKFKVVRVEKTTTPNGDPMYKIYLNE